MIPKQLKNLKFCRIKKGTKKPFEKNWTNKPYTAKEISKFKGENYGVLCGYENLAVIDCDEESMQVAVKNMFPKTFRVKTPNGFHNYFFIPDLKQKLILETETGTHLGEIQSHGTQVVAPNSIHPTGKKYEVLEDIKIATISCAELYEKISPFIKQVKQTEENVKWERKEHSEVDELSVAQIWGTTGLKKHNDEYYGEHPTHGSDGGMNFWINPLKNMWHCFRCDSGGGVLSAIGVKEGIIDCSEARKGNLRGDKAFQCIEKAREKYGLKEDYEEQKRQRELKILEKHFGGELKTAPKEKIKIIWDSELKDWEEEEKEWIIDKLIPSRSVCVFTGKRGTLKTFMALMMGYSVASGNDFLGHFPTRKGGVIYLDKENGIPIMKKRTAMIKKGMEIDENPLKIGFICFSQLKIDKNSDIAQIEELIKVENPLLLIIDTYRRGISFDENDAGAVSELFVDILRPLAEKNNISILLIHHNRKGSGGEAPDEMDEIRGSSDLANYADIIMKMERRKGTIILKQLKNRNAQEIEPMKINGIFTDDSLKMSYEGTYEKQTQAEKCVEVLSIWIAEKGIEQFSTADAKEIAFKQGIRERNFTHALNLLQDSGVIKNTMRGHYEVQ
jgi:RecA-family ATPase